MKIDVYKTGHNKIQSIKLIQFHAFRFFCLLHPYHFHGEGLSLANSFDSFKIIQKPNFSNTCIQMQRNAF